jgi:hypothetical protein
MNSHEKEINALLTLLDDPDREVLVHVEEKLLSYGESVIPSLENFWEQSDNNQLQERIEMIIHRIHFKNLVEEFTNWNNGDTDLLHGAFLVSKYQYPELQHISTLQEIERIRRNIWLEMNSYLTPLEHIKIMESILFGFYKFRGGELAFDKPNEFMINKVVETKKGNALTNGILYLAFAEMLDLPVKAIRIPRQFVLSWFSHQALFENDFTDGNPSEKIKFFIDPNSGTGFAHKDIDNYLDRIKESPRPAFYKPQTNKQVIKMLLLQFAKCFDKPENEYKRDELEYLASLITT